MKNKTYGQHLIIDCYGIPAEFLHDTDKVYRFLANLPSLIDMESIGPPDLAIFDEPEQAGITGIIQIVTSHISFHGYSLKGSAFIDVFSCKQFDSKIVIGSINSTFNPATIDIVEIERGKRFPVTNIYNETSITKKNGS